MNSSDSSIKLLSSFGYIQNQSTRVWARQSSNPISYSDGTEVEDKLNSILDQVTDLSADSEELNRLITDWPTRYYFSSYRANLLRPIKNYLAGNVLEVGSGCGALTRFLGETAKSVIAIEGGVERAKICARRCKDLDNVQIICEQFENFSSDVKFDAITLIGVLEYSRIYGGGENGPRNLLSTARQLLAPGGVLIIAIENQLGIKYFAGANEDHVNVPWFGVSDLYDSNGAVTFGKLELIELLKSSGFKHTDFYIPLPDYKLPVSVINGSAIEHAKSLGVDSSLFAAMSVSADPNNAATPNFPLELTSRVIGRNNLDLDLANSFLVICKQDCQQDSVSKNNLPIVFHYGSTRRKAFTKETILKINDNKVYVERTPTYPNQATFNDGCYYIDWKDQPYIKGELHIEKLFRIVNTEGWNTDQIAKWAEPWIQILRKNIKLDLDSDSQIERLPPNFLDATPFNLVKIEGQTESSEFIDLEWCDTRGPEFLHVVIRGLLGCFDKISSVAKPDKDTLLPLSHLGLLQDVLRNIPSVFFCFDDINRALTLENQFRVAATGQDSKITTKSLQHKTIKIRTSHPSLEIPTDRPTLSDQPISSESSNLDSIYNLFSHYKALSQTEKFLRDKLLLEKINKTIQLQKKPDAIAGLQNLVIKYPKYSLFGFIKDSIRLLRSLGLFRAVLKQQGIIGAVVALLTWIILRISGLFDYQYYLDKNPALNGVKFDLLLHYITLGANDNLNPNILFETRWYRRKYISNKTSIINPLLHYVLRSPKYTQSPHPIFDSRYYRIRYQPSYWFFNTDLYHYLTKTGPYGGSCNPEFIATYYYEQLGDNTNIKYDLISDYLNNKFNSNLNPNPFFDSQFYLKNNSDVLKSNEPAFAHYCMHGAGEGRDPSEEFSVAGYYKFNPDIKEHRREALSHYLEFGIHENRRAITRVGYQNLLNQDRPINFNLSRTKLTPPTINLIDLQALPARIDIPVDTQGIDVIVPVYKGKDETLACIASVLKSQSKVPIRLIVVDDCSPDTELAEVLSTLSKLGKFILIKNDTNIGFVNSVNKGMQYSTCNDVVLLNSDTEVNANWLERLNVAAYSSSDIGTVTPYSNSATICSYPAFCHDTSHSLEVTPFQIDQIASEVNRNTYIDIPTAVGFCMYIKRVCLNKVGLFDADKFGLGYGEENDFCLRASLLNYKHVLAADTYVLHYGSTSFAESKLQRVQQATQIINRDFPRYQQDVQQFIDKDPAQLSRLKLDLARVQKVLLPKRFLFVSHIRGGGTKRHMQQLENSLLGAGVSVVYLESSTNGSGGFNLRVSGLSTNDIPTLCGIEFSDKSDLLESILKFLRISHAHIHSMIDFKLSTVGHVLKILNNLSIEFDVTIHDYAWFCPLLHMVDHTDFYCGGAERKKCQSCVNLNGSCWGHIDIDPFRQENELFLNSARRVFCPSKDVLDRVRCNYPDAKLQIKPHPASVCISDEITPLKASRSQTRKVCLLGAISKHKGSDILLKCVKDAYDRSLPLEFIVIGFTDNQSELLKSPNISCTGAYEEKDLPNLIAYHGAGICWFPSVCPETYSYTLDTAFAEGLFPISFNFGAIAERITSVDWGITIDSALKDNPSAINDILLGAIVPEKVSLSKVKKQLNSYPDIIADYYSL